MNNEGGSGKKGRHKKSKVVPYSKLDEDKNTEGYELNSIENEKDNKKKSFKLNKLKTTASVSLSLIANVQQKANKWRRYTNSRRHLPFSGSMHEGGGQNRNTGGLGLGEIDSVYTHQEARSMVVASNRALIQLFAKLGQSKNTDEVVDLEFVESLLKNGAKIDCTDKYGQTIFHEIARAWHTDVAKFLLEHGANVNTADNYGRTPLHVAAAVDYPEMVEFLIQNGADKEAKTKGEDQTPVFFAARNDACKSLKKLIQSGCEYKTIRDYKGRTPLHLAAELDRSETARMLLELDAPAGVTDNCGQAAIVWMITKMAPVAKEALDQFHVTDRANRKQYYYLNHLEPHKPDQTLGGCAFTPLESTVNQKQFDVILHPVMTRLIKIKWQYYARQGAWITLIINFLFILVWTLIAMTTNYALRHMYTFPDDWWRVLLWIIAIGIWAYQIVDECTDIYTSNRKFKRWREWRLSEIDRDMKFTHPRWPEEEEFLRCEQQDVDRAKPQYFSDFWNIFDWICYAFLLATIITHIIDVAMHSEFLARLHIRIQAFNIIILWLRLMKNARAFAALGPFIVMLGHILSDCAKFFYLYLEFYIPFSCAFWMIFGGEDRYSMSDIEAGITNATQPVLVDGHKYFGETLFSMIRMTLVDDYDFNNMLLVDGVMTYLLLIGWLGLSAILCLNLFIALLSDTFQRVYDNAHANAVMQKAITILSIQDDLSKKKKRKFREHIHTQCAPEKLYYDDDLSTSGDEDLKRATIQIRDDLQELKEWWKSEYDSQDHHDILSPRGDDDDHHGGGGGDAMSLRRRKSSHESSSLVSRDHFENELETLREEIRDIRDKQEEMATRFKRDCISMKTLLFQIAAFQGVPGIPQSTISAQPITSRSEAQAQTQTALDEWEKKEKLKRREYRIRKKKGDDSVLHETSLLTSEELATPQPSTGGATDAPDAVPPVEPQEPTIEVYTNTLPPFPNPRNDDGPRPPTSVDVQIRPTVLNMEKMPADDC